MSPFEVLTVESAVFSPLSQHALPKKVDYHLFQSMLMTSTPGKKARLLSASAPHASSWLLVAPSVRLGLHLDPAEFQAAVKWWLGMNSSVGVQCAHSVQTPFWILLDINAVSCRHGGDVVIKHNHLRNIFTEFRHRRTC